MEPIIKPKTAALDKSPKAQYLEVGTEYEGQRLDNFLFRELKGVPKTHIYRIIRSGEVRCNKGRVQADSRVHAGDRIRIPPIRLPDKSADIPAPAKEFPILFEDDWVLAINKPAGVAVHGGSGVSFGVIEQLRQARPAAKYLELVHRLDRETSGILLLAKKSSALKHLQEQFRERETSKIYFTLVLGDWPANLKVIDSALHKYLTAEGERRVRTVAKEHPDAMRSVTIIKSVQKQDLGELGGFSLLEVSIKTGRTHQIRVHLASSGYPIAGDDKYGDFELNKRLQKKGLARMFLHAHQLAFSHPHSQERIELTALLPPDLAKVLPKPAV